MAITNTKIRVMALVTLVILAAGTTALLLWLDGGGKDKSRNATQKTAMSQGESPTAIQNNPKKYTDVSTTITGTVYRAGTVYFISGFDKDAKPLKLDLSKSKTDINSLPDAPTNLQPAAPSQGTSPDPSQSSSIHMSANKGRVTVIGKLNPSDSSVFVVETLSQVNPDKK